ncbi:TlpA disulfide reductase family protein [Porticoccus sp. W117]|uniref:TlpA family protein disulfide reductase n=1 Tax=Porticoccus sp. W117 TaxID=3054777 RepID=UPI0025965A35|nr:TlpA disulfide reductase family protein [Porticoccus sp. W117]MDM3871876.1 TlpA disulfide reductase family protein [Porticoccus sp. W117]
MIAKTFIARTCRLLIVPLALVALCGAKSTDKHSLVGVGDPAPAFSVTTTDGVGIDTEALKGKVILVNFFATWCPPCMVKLPQLEKNIYQQIDHEDLVMVNLGREHNSDEMAEFKEEHGYSMPFAADPDRAIYSQYADLMIPRSVIIGRDGSVVVHQLGVTSKEVEHLKQVIQQQLDAS